MSSNTANLKGFSKFFIKCPMGYCKKILIFWYLMLNTSSKLSTVYCFHFIVIQYFSYCVIWNSTWKMNWHLLNNYKSLCIVLGKLNKNPICFFISFIFVHLTFFDKPLKFLIIRFKDFFNENLLFQVQLTQNVSDLVNKIYITFFV